MHYLLSHAVAVLEIKDDSDDIIKKILFYSLHVDYNYKNNISICTTKAYSFIAYA